MARQIEKQNLLARINLPMGRVEIRTDDGCHPLDVDVANLTLKHLLLIRFYGDAEFARSFRYDREDIARARKNEELAARNGLRAEIENPLTGKPAAMREFLQWTLDELQPLAEALGLWEDLHPLVEMASGAPNTAEQIRARIQDDIGPGTEVPLAVLRALAEAREEQVCHDVEEITAKTAMLGSEGGKLDEFLTCAREDTRSHPELPVRFRPSGEAFVETAYTDKTAEIIDLAQYLIRIPSVTACPSERLDEVHRASAFIYEYMKNNGADVRHLDEQCS
jgi:hypothetical protein